MSEVKGSIKKIGTTETVGASGFRKRELVVTTDEQYPQFISIEFVQDKCDILDSYKVGQNVNVSINLRGREWINPEGVAKYFNQIQGWRIERLEVTDVPPLAPLDNIETNEPDDLPF